MKLSEAIAFVRDVRPTWMEDSKSWQTNFINSNHAFSVLGDLEMEEITTLHYIEIQKHFKAKGLKAGTINRITSALSTVFSELKTHKLIAEIVRCPHNLKEPKGRKCYYTDDEVQALMDACDSLRADDAMLMKDLIFVASRTGAREGELLRLKWTNIYFDIDALVFLDTKDGSDRVVPMSSGVKTLLERLYDERIDDDTVFKTSKDKVIRRIHRLKKIAGITEKEKCFHTLRHGVATSLFEKGATLPEVMAVLGHSQVETTMRYAKATEEGKKRALNLLDR